MRHQQVHPCLKIPGKEYLKLQLITWSSSHFWSLIDLLSFHMPKLARQYERAIQQEYSKEYDLFHLTKKQKVLHIGCGSYPLTDVLLAYESKVGTILCIDTDGESVKHARQIIKKHHLENRVSVKRGDGSGYSVRHFDVIIVSSCSWPKLFILDNMFTQAKPGCLFIIRELDIAVDLIIHCIRTHSDLLLKKRLVHHPFPFLRPFGWQTFYLEKK